MLDSVESHNKCDDKSLSPVPTNLCVIYLLSSMADSPSHRRLSPLQKMMKTSLLTFILLLFSLDAFFSMFMGAFCRRCLFSIHCVISQTSSQNTMDMQREKNVMKNLCLTPPNGSLSSSLFTSIVFMMIISVMHHGIHGGGAVTVKSVLCQCHKPARVEWYIKWRKRQRQCWLDEIWCFLLTLSSL